MHIELFPALLHCTYVGVWRTGSPIGEYSIMYLSLQVTMSTSKVFQRFYAKLVKTLPMDDALFIAELFSANLLPGNIKNQVKSMNTKADKATHFLDHVIQPSVASGVGKSFDDLIEIMADSEYDGVKELAKLIRCRLKEAAESSETSGKLTYFIYVIRILLHAIQIFYQLLHTVQEVIIQ